MKVYQKTIDQVAALLKTNKTTGLTEQQVHELRTVHGFNTTKSDHSFSVLRTFVGQLCEPLILLLAASSSIIFLTGDHFDAFIILGIIGLNATIGTFQERRIALMVKKLKNFKKNKATVIRDGKTQVVPEQFLVPGDLIVVQEGESIPVDARIIEAYDILVDESVLTGESEVVKKQAHELSEELPLYQQSNMLFCGSYLVTGYAKALVVATGMQTETKKVEQSVEVFSAEMPLQKDLSNVLRFILWLIVFICGSLFFIGIAAGKPFGELLAALIALFMCVVPQGLPVIMTIILVTGAYAMARRNIVAKRLQAIEALGRAQVMVIDKTGTITKNELMVCAVGTGDTLYAVTGKGYSHEGHILLKEQVVTREHGPIALQKLMEAVVLLNNSVVEYAPSRKKFLIKGSPNEAAMGIAAVKYGLSFEQVAGAYKKLYEIPFSAAHQFHAGFYAQGMTGELFAIGSFEVFARRCNSVSEQHKEQVQSLLAQGMRVLVVVHKTFSLDVMPHGEEEQKKFFVGLCDNGLEFLGQFGIQDTLREHVPAAIAAMQKAGLHIVMATGDNAVTAQHIATAAGITVSGSPILEGVKFHYLTDDKAMKMLDSTTVCSRFLPVDKLRLVTLFQKQGKVTVVVGDGVNDAPALATAHVGVSMGGAGSEVAKEAAHIILVEDEFEKLVVGIEYGRHIFYTFRRVILYFFTTNFAEVLIMLFALGGGFPVPLVAAQILWLNLVTDGFLDTALSLEPLEKNLMRPTWLKDYAALLDRTLMFQVIYLAILGAGLSFGVFVWYLQSSVEVARTMAMVTLTCCQWVTAIGCRSLEQSIFSLKMFSNRLLAAALGGILVTQIAIIYVPFLQSIFQTTALRAQDWYVVCVVGIILLVAQELQKLIRTRFQKAR